MGYKVGDGAEGAPVEQGAGDAPGEGSMGQEIAEISKTPPATVMSVTLRAGALPGQTVIVDALGMLVRASSTGTRAYCVTWSSVLWAVMQMCGRDPAFRAALLARLAEAGARAGGEE
jgi:hypothetical protein